jgi:hypothetical protein
MRCWMGACQTTPRVASLAANILEYAQKLLPKGCHTFFVRFLRNLWQPHILSGLHGPGQYSFSVRKQTYKDLLLPKAVVADQRCLQPILPFLQLVVY